MEQSRLRCTWRCQALRKWLETRLRRKKACSKLFDAIPRSEQLCRLASSIYRAATSIKRCRCCKTQLRLVPHPRKPFTCWASRRREAISIRKPTKPTRARQLSHRSSSSRYTRHFAAGWVPPRLKVKTSRLQTYTYKIGDHRGNSLLDDFRAAAPFYHSSPAQGEAAARPSPWRQFRDANIVIVADGH